MTTNDIYNPFKTYPNQLFGQICKPKYKEKGVKFMYVGIEEIREAAKTLTPSGLKLYLYFAENEGDWKFNLSPKNFQKAYDVAESTYRKAKQELIDKRYIVEQPNNHFIFYTSPAEATISMEDLREEIIRIAEHIKEYNKEIYNSFNNEAIQTNQLDEIEKKKKGLDMLKRMRKELDRLQRENSTFNF